MLIGNINTLQTVNSLYFTDHVILYGTDSLDLQKVMRIYTTFGKFITGLQYRTVCDLDTGSVRDQVSLGLSVFRIGNDNFTLLLGILNRSYAAKFCNNCKSLRLTCFKKLLDTGKTLCDIITGNTTGMEGTHGQLCTGFTDGLCCNNTNCFTNLNRFTGCHVGTVTFCTDTIVGTTGKNRTDLDLLNRIT